jgi:hypothetical protein
MLSGALPNVLYCGWLMKRNGSGHRYRVGRSNWMLAAIMAVFWFGSTLLYGVAAGQLGTWGPILGWPLFMSLIVITATACAIARIALACFHCGSKKIKKESGTTPQELAALLLRSLESWKSIVLLDQSCWSFAHSRFSWRHTFYRRQATLNFQPRLSGYKSFGVMPVANGSLNSCATVSDR